MPIFQKISLLFILICFSSLLSFFYKKNLTDYFAESEKKTAIVSVLPDIVYTDVLTGEKVKIDTNDEVKVVHLWGTWCGPCEVEFPELMKLVNSLKAEKIAFYLIAVNDDLDKVKRFIARFKGQLASAKVHILLDDQDLALKGFGTVKVPETYVYSVNNAAVKKYIGPQNWDTPFFFHDLKSFIP